LALRSPAATKSAAVSAQCAAARAACQVPSTIGLPASKA
jgi:hypothetical protein